MLEASSKASIINVSSIAAFRPSVRAPAYGAVKAAMVHYTASQAAALARKRIRVNCIAPGSIEFPGGHWESVKLAGDPLYQQIVSKIPARRMGTPDEVADVALFFASPYARWVTGQTIAVDGGQLLGA
jgi:3-oxoacyl-[acyl-carrier protein] reductase